MLRGAKILVDTCARLKKSEVAVVITDEQLLAIGKAVMEAAREVSEAILLISPPRQIDNEEPVRPVARAMREADVIFLPVSLALAHTLAVREAIVGGSRVLSMTAFTERMMKEGGLFADFHSRKPLCDGIAERLTKASRVRVTNAAGTDLSFSVETRTGNSHSCLLDGPGFTAVPNIEANISPEQGTAEGLLAVDGSIPYYGIGVLPEPLIFEIHHGFLTTIRGGGQADFLRELLASQDDPYVYNVAQFAVGLNLECHEFTGEMLNDEGINGTIHIGIGTSANLGGNVQAKTHFDAIIREPSVWFDDVLIIDAGDIAISH